MELGVSMLRTTVSRPFPCPFPVSPFPGTTVSTVVVVSVVTRIPLLGGSPPKEEEEDVESVDVVENVSELRDPSNGAFSAVNPPPPPGPPPGPSKNDFSFPRPVLIDFGIDAGSILTSFAF
ncbi:hypothetical protein ABT160_10155 [Streptomyces sp. NPDC001941]|uniref:hypothetical protein n=1 Tax=Streptomyces sp. NPDC001941 TaxID=3154659 RepID=UPI003322E2FB